MTRRPRVVIDGRFIQDHFPGVGRYCFGLIEALSRADDGLDFLVPCAPAGRITRFDTTLLSRGPVTAVPVDVPLFSVREQFAMPRFARAAGADLWHSPHPWAPLLLPCPRIVTCHDAIPLLHPESLTPWWRRPAVSFLLRGSVRAARTVLTGSTAARKDLISLLGAPSDRTVVIPYGVDSRFAPQDAAVVARTRIRYGLPEKYALQLSSGRSHKNVDRLLDAWKIATAEGALNGLVLAVAGIGGASPSPTTRFLGPVPEADLPALYAGARFFVLPSLWEGFGLPVLEAMACGTPVICSGTSSLPEVAGEAAVFFDPRDVRSIAGAIARVAVDGGLRERLRARGLERAAAFTWAATARRCAEEYWRALGRAPGSGEGRSRP
jgi:glycosyltransferase involved in cell wall biosynthesis